MLLWRKKNLKFIGYSTELQSRFIVFSPFIFYVDFTPVLYITQTLSTLAFLWNFNPYMVIYRGWRLIKIGLVCYGYTFVQITILEFVRQPYYQWNITIYYQNNKISSFNRNRMHILTVPSVKCNIEIQKTFTNINILTHINRHSCKYNSDNMENNISLQHAWTNVCLSLLK